MLKLIRRFLIFAIVTNLATKSSAASVGEGQDRGGKLIRPALIEEKVPDGEDDFSRNKYLERLDKNGGTESTIGPPLATKSLILLEENIKGIKGLPEMTREEASLMENMHTISPEDELFKHVFKDRKKLTDRDKRSQNIHRADSREIPVPSREKELEEEREIRYKFEAAKERRSIDETGKNSNVSFGLINDKSVEDNTKEIATGGEDVKSEPNDQERDKRNIFFDKKEDENTYKDDYSSPDYVDIEEREEKLPIKTEEGNNELRLATGNPNNVDSRDGVLENDLDNLTVSNSSLEGGVSEGDSIRERRQESKYVIAPPTTPLSLNQIVKNIADDGRKNVTDEELYEQLADTEKAVAKSSLPWNLTKVTDLSATKLKEEIWICRCSTGQVTATNESTSPKAQVRQKSFQSILKSLAGSLNAKVSDKEFAGEIAATMRAMRGSARRPKRINQSNRVNSTYISSMETKITTVLTRMKIMLQKKITRLRNDMILRRKHRRQFPGYRNGKGVRLPPFPNFIRKRYLRKRRRAETNKWTSWGSWGDCSATCGKGGTVTRQRLCVAPPCKGEDRHKKKCGSNKPCPTKTAPFGTWHMWGRWSPCSVSCGLGLEVQKRKCSTSRCHGPNRRSRHCIKKACSPLLADEPKQIIPGTAVRLRCIYNHVDPVKKIYWVTPRGYNIVSTEANPRITMAGDYLYIGSPTSADRGMYHCVIVRHSGIINTSDALVEMRSCRNIYTCMNGGVCVDYKNHWGYKCICPANYKGMHCEISDSLLPWMILLLVLVMISGGLLIFVLFIYCRRTGDRRSRSDWSLPSLPSLRRPRLPSIPSLTSCYKGREPGGENQPLLEQAKPDDAQSDVPAQVFIMPEHPGRNSEHIYDIIEEEGTPQSLTPLGIRQKALNSTKAAKLRTTSTPAADRPSNFPEVPPRRYSTINQKSHRDRSPLSRTRQNDEIDDSREERLVLGDSWDLLPHLSKELEGENLYLKPHQLEMDVVKAGEDSYLDMSAASERYTEESPRGNAESSTPVPGNWFTRKINVVVKGLTPKKKTSPGKEQLSDADAKNHDDCYRRSMLEVAGMVTPPNEEQVPKVTHGNDSKPAGSWVPLNEETSRAVPGRPLYKSGIEFSPKASQVQSKVFIDGSAPVEPEPIYVNEVAHDRSAPVEPEPIYVNEVAPDRSPSGSEDEVLYENPYAKWSPGGPIPPGPANMPGKALNELQREFQHKGMTPERPTRPEPGGNLVGIRLFSSEDNLNNGNNLEDEGHDDLDDDDHDDAKQKEAVVQGAVQTTDASVLIAQVHAKCVSEKKSQAEQSPSSPEKLEKMLNDLRYAVGEKIGK